MAAPRTLAPPGREEELLLCCARLRPSPEARGRIGAILAEPCDWGRIVRLALHHKMTPLLYRQLARRPEVPAEVREALRRHQREHARHGLALLGELLDLLGAFERAGIPAVPFKGPALAELAYGSLAARLSGDLDLLVRPEDVARVAAALEARGYVEQTRWRTGEPLDAAEDAWYRHVQAEYVYLRPRDGMVVEPHWALTPYPLAVAFDLEGIWRRTRRFTLAGREVLGLSLEDLVVALCVHGSKHEWTELRWICDIAELLARRPEIDWPGAHARAEEQGCARMLRLGLALAEGVLGAELPGALRAAVSEDAALPALAAQVESHLFDVDYDAPSVFRVSRFRLRMRERLRDRVACLVRTLTTPQIAHVRLFRLPRPLWPLYAVLTPAIDYLGLPLRRRLAPWLHPGAVRSEALEALAALSGADARLGVALDALAGETLADCEAQLAQALDASARVLSLAGVRSAEVGSRPSAGEATGAARALATRVHCVPGEALPFAPRCFDAVLCRFAWLLWEEPEQGLREVHRLLRPGGRVGVGAFAALAANPLLAVADRVARELVGSVAVPSGPILGSFARRGALARTLRRAGFERIEERALWYALEPVEARAVARALLAASAGLELRDLPEQARASVAEALAAALPVGAVRVGVRVATGFRMA